MREHSLDAWWSDLHDEVIFIFNFDEHAMKTLHELFIAQLKDLYDGEQRIVKFLPQVMKLTESSNLEAAFKEHLKQTKKQVTRLERIFKSMKEKPKGVKSEVMEALVAQAKEMTKGKKPADVKDAAIIAGAQKIEHYEIVGYGTVLAWAKQMGHEKAAVLLEETLNEEKAADQKLTQIAEGAVNPAAQEEALAAMPANA